ncbi:MAG TPA: hypothetical protein VKQ34_02440 [Candidatus Saccharimonadales bacterium]|nr:hypothetical protein [Candidatus Saccharimonadales bacterium]
MRIIPKKAKKSPASKPSKQPPRAAGQLCASRYIHRTTYYDEDSYSISAQNATGPFDILAHHHNFLTLLNPGDLVIKPVNGVQEQKIRISGGLMHVKADKVTVFLDI